MTRKLGWRWHGNPYDPEMPPGVDLHFCFWNPATTFLSVPGVNDFWRRRMNRQIGGLSFPALSPPTISPLTRSTFFAICSAGTGSYTTSTSWHVSFRTMQKMRTFWQTWTAIHDDSLRGLQAIAFWLAREWFNCNWARAVDLEVSRIPRPVRQWLDRFSQSPLTACFTPISMVYGYTSACSSHVGIACSFSAARYFLFGFRLWVRPDRTRPKRVKRESCGLRSATRSMYCTSSSASHFIFEPCPTPFGTVLLVV